ncbi:MAG TPA: thiol reductant ABC exporter subunit CydD [Desulfurivibrio alkaliphilus]|uniref:Thiol reductant ABC exporter subunit CydD n=1 Tax=Desulfurivibrio alkaliphilus TaxID=427923 RepID=A0A7C2XF74_9BACT|nr:thiol reductant ABC exporter subunit CydD [Desulfurivibrio alkaliphilus]
MTEANGLAWLAGYRKHAGSLLLMAVGLGFTAGILLIIQASLLSRVVTQVVFAGQGLSQVLPHIWLILALVGGRALLVGGGRYCGGLAAVRVKEAVRRDLLDHLAAASPVGLTGGGAPGELVDLSVDGSEFLDGYFSGYLPQMAMAVLMPAAILAFIFPLDLVAALILLFTAPLIPFFMVIIGRRAERLNRRFWNQTTRLSHRFLDTIQGLTTLKIFNAGHREARVVAEISRQYGQSTLAVLRVAFLSALALEFLATISVALVAVIIGFKLLWGDLTFAAGFLILILAPEFYLPLRNLGSNFHARAAAITTAEKMLRLLRLPLREQHEATGHDLPAPASGPGSYQITLAGVSYGYEAGREAVRDLSITLPTRGLCCLYGPSGSGKSTVLKLIGGLLKPQRGKILINGSDLGRVELSQWHRQLAYLPQKPHLLQRSVRENIKIGNPEATMAEIRRAAVGARIDRELAELPAGYDTLLGEEGQDLSGGQRQRVALARVLVSSRPLVLLDEPTAGLDQASSELVRQTIVELARSRTVVMVTHDHLFLPLADKVIRLDEGIYSTA